MMHVAENTVSSFKRSARAGGLLTVLALALVAAADSGCSKSSSSPSEKSCSGAQALTDGALTGASLPLKTLSLTFDDGPGARTIELSHYLKSEGIRATFFIMGKAFENAGNGPDVLQALVDDGHLIGNHTETHRSLTQNQPTPLTDQEIVAELTQVDGMISPWVKDNKWVFRPPFGDFDSKTYAALQNTPMGKYVGPILWDIGGTMALPNRAADFQCWTDPTTKTSVTACGDGYLKEIDNVGKGIVLMHDPYFIDQNNPESGGTYQMIQYVVPKLKAAGYKFVRLDEVPAIQKLLSGDTSAPDAGSSPNGQTPGSSTNDPGSSGTNSDNPCP